MLKAVLQYSCCLDDCSQDGKKVFEILTHNNIIIVRTRDGWSKPSVTVLFEDYGQLNSVLHALNVECHNEVRLVRYRELKKRG